MKINKTKITKGVFTTCKIKREMSSMATFKSKKITHDKNKKLFIIIILY